MVTVWVDHLWAKRPKQHVTKPQPKTKTQTKCLGVKFLVHFPFSFQKGIGNKTQPESKCPELLANYCDMLLRKTPLSKRLSADEIETKLKEVVSNLHGNMGFLVYMETICIVYIFISGFNTFHYSEFLCYIFHFIFFIQFYTYLWQSVGFSLLWHFMISQFLKMTYQKPIFSSSREHQLTLLVFDLKLQTL